ncbi:hypothetical protein ACPV5W_00890 [Vibrio astriarenae]
MKARTITLLNNFISLLLMLMFCIAIVYWSSKHRVESLHLFEYRSLAIEALEAHARTYDDFNNMFEDIVRTNQAVMNVLDSSWPLPVVINASYVTIESIDYPLERETSNYSLMIEFDGHTLGAIVTFGHNINYLVLLSYSILAFIFGHATYFLFLFIRKSINSQDIESVRVTALEQKITLVLSSLTDIQKRWYQFGRDRYHCPIKGLNMALMAEELTFDTVNYRIIIKGETIDLPKTPFLYYLWYTQRYLHRHAMYLNPSSNKPDIEAGMDIASVMERYGGVSRIIEELQNVGVRAKQLDVNRNKVKERLESYLGDVSEDYLFYKERDPKSHRFYYGLRLDGVKISLD